MSVTSLGRGKAVHLTERTVQGLKPDKDRTRRIWSSNLPGFHVVVYPTGRKAYYLHSTDPTGRSRFKKVSDTSVLVFAEALELASDLKRELLLNKADPALTIDRGFSPTTATLRQAYEAVLRSKTVPLADCSTGYVANFQRTLERYAMDALGSRLLSELSAADYRPLVNAIVEQGKSGAAQNFHALLGSMYMNIQCLPGFEDVINPLRGVRFAIPRSKPRDRVLDDRELAFVWQNFGDDNPIHRAAVQFMILTGQRVQQTLSTEWDQIDWEEKRIDWRKSQMKGKRPHAIPLTQRMIEILVPLRGLNERYIFPHVNGRSSKPTALGYSALHVSIGAFCETHRMEKWSSHCLRHSLASNAIGRAGVAVHDISALLHHLGESITSNTYLHAHQLPAMSRAMEEHEAWLSRKGVFGQESAEVVSLHG